MVAGDWYRASSFRSFVNMVLAAGAVIAVYLLTAKLSRGTHLLYSTRSLREPRTNKEQDT